MARTRHRIGNLNILLPFGYERPKLPWKRKWVNALRSGGFPQGKTFLFDGEKYDPLGVLSFIQKRLVHSGTDTNDCINRARLSYSNPCYAVLGSLGSVPDGVQMSLHKRIFTCLSEVNDTGKFTFNQIADLIELIWKD